MSSDCIHRIHKWRPGASWRPNAETRRCRIRITGHRGNDYINISVIPGSSLAGRNPAQLEMKSHVPGFNAEMIQRKEYAQKLNL